MRQIDVVRRTSPDQHRSERVKGERVIEMIKGEIAPTVSIGSNGSGKRSNEADRVEKSKGLATMKETNQV